jgi:hypothetical protein
VATRAPQVAWPLELLSFVLQEERDWAAAERVLRRALELEPGNAHAWCSAADVAVRHITALEVEPGKAHA